MYRNNILFQFHFLFPHNQEKKILKNTSTRGCSDFYQFWVAIRVSPGFHPKPIQSLQQTQKKIKVKTNTPTSLRKQLFSRLLSKSSVEYLLTDVLKTRQLFYSIHHRGRGLQILAKFPLDFVRMGFSFLLF